MIIRQRQPQLQTRNAGQAGMRRVPARAIERRATTSLATRASTVDVAARTFEAIASTETPVRRYVELDGFGYVQADEVLPTGAVDISAIAGRAPLLDGHNTSSTDAVLGSIEGARTETVAGLGEVLILTCRVSEGTKGDEVLAKLASGAINAVSVGYRVAEYDVAVREGQPPVATAVAWSLAELSLVPVGADPNARIRTADVAAQPAADAVVQPGAEVTLPAGTQISTPAPADLAAMIASAVTEALAARDAAAAAATPEVATATPETATPAAGERAAPEIDTRAILDALREAGRGDPRVRTIRALASHCNAGPLGEQCIRQGMTVEQAREMIRAAGIARTEAGADPQTRSAPGPEGEPPERPVIDTGAIMGRLAATTSLNHR